MIESLYHYYAKVIEYERIPKADTAKYSWSRRHEKQFTLRTEGIDVTDSRMSRRYWRSQRSITSGHRACFFTLLEPNQRDGRSWGVVILLIKGKKRLTRWVFP